MASRIPFDPDALLKRCPGSDDSVELRRKVPPTSHGQSSASTQSHVCDDGQNVHFDETTEQLFIRRYSEGYDLHDDEYFSWLRIYHPEALKPCLMTNLQLLISSLMFSHFQVRLFMTLCMCLLYSK